MPYSPVPPSRSRALLGLCGVVVLSLGAAGLLLAAATSPDVSTGADVLVRRVFAWLGALACLRYTLAALAGLLLVAGRRGGRVPAPRTARLLDLIGPAWLKRLAAASLGTVVLATVGVGAQADSPSSGWTGTDDVTIVGLGQKVRPGAADTAVVPATAQVPVESETPAPPTLPPPTPTPPTPEPPASEPPASEPEQPAEPLDAETPAPATYTVQRGDSLWHIAQLHGATSDAAAAAAWPSWYELNRDVIGPDPDLIHPGQVLQVPAGDRSEAAS